MIRRILVGLAGTPYTAASIATAVELATCHGAELTGVTVIDLAKLENVGPVPVGAGQAAHELREYRVQVTRERVEQDIADFASACAVAQIHGEVKSEERENAFDFLISQARYHDLMVFGLRSVFEYDVAGHHVSDPSLILVRLITEGVRPIVAVTPEYKTVSRVMIAFSGSMESAKTMKRFVQLRPWPAENVCILTFDDNEEHGRQLLADAARYCRAHGIDAETKLISDSPKERLLLEADAWGADLLVLGNSGKRLLLRRAFGETALRAIREAQCPLFLAQ